MKIKKLVTIFAVISISILFVNLIYGKSLWVDSAELFLDKKPINVGDAITILFNNNVIVKYKAQSQGDSTAILTPPKTASSTMSFLPNIDYSSDSSYTKNVNTQADGSITGEITVEVLSSTNNNLLIGGGHTIIINGETESISLSAIAPQNKIKKGNIIYSTDLINPVINYKGLAVSKGTNFNTDNVIISTNETGQTIIEFSEEEKNNIIIEYLNKALESLFSY